MAHKCIKKALKVFLIIISCIVLVAIWLLSLCYKYSPPGEFHFDFGKTNITDPEQYGIFEGPGTTNFTCDYINSIFPAELSPSFDVVNYSYKTANTGTYSFEAYLEFKIEDTDEFNAYIASIAPQSEWTVFEFDDDFFEYKIENVLFITRDVVESHEEYGCIPLERAKIRKILYNPETQTVIYVALGVYAGGGFETAELNVFFNRFDIDPIEYYLSADSMEGVSPYSY